jgi:xanthine dehydrogenase accessory factor
MNPYNIIRDKNANSSITLASVIDGKNKCEKALWIDENLQWESRQNTILRQYASQILSQTKSTVIDIDSNRIFCEKIGNRQKLIICGAGHVSISIIELAKKIGFKVTVIDDRPTFADNARLAGADVSLCDNFLNALDKQKGGSDTYFVIVTRGHRYDMDCLKNILSKKSTYVGMMGSKRRVAMIKKELTQEGFSSDVLEQLHAPIGLSIGAQTPEEIAISIMAELIQVKNTTHKISIYDDELLSYIAGDKDTDEYGVFCTIVEKKGSAPRECGTKMLILPNNKIIGTIGGGCAEARVIEIGRYMLAGDEYQKLELVDMTAEEAEIEGMVCGGTILVYMEKIRVCNTCI